jgi:DNA-binding CsgD family transcriptional regulator
LARAQRAHWPHAAEGVLTPAEQGIAELGRTNTEIGSDASHQRKTVERKPTRIYRKPGGRIYLARQTPITR